MFKTVKQLREDIAASNSRIDAIIDLAKEDKRDLTADEQAEVNAWHGEGDDGGEFAKQEAKLKQAIRIEARQAEIASTVMVPTLEGAGNGPVDLRSGDFSGVRVPANARAVAPLVNFHGPDAEKEAYATGQWFCALAGNERSKAWCLENGLSINAANVEGTDSLGGFTVPAPLEAALIRIVVQHGVFRRYAATKTMTSATLTTPRRVGGLQVTHPGEGGLILKSKMAFGNVVLTAKKYAALAKHSTELSEDSVLSIIDEIVTEIGLAMAAKEDANGFLGDGTAAFASVTGLDNALLAQSILQSTATTAAGLTLTDYNNLIGKVPDYTGMMPVWFCNKSVYFASMQPLMLAAGGATTQDIANGAPPRFLGHDVIFTNVMKTASSLGTGDTATFFGDLRMTATMGNRRGVSFKVLMEKYADEDMIGIISTARTAIEVHEPGFPAVSAVAATATDAAIAAEAAKAGPMVKLTLT